ncbi:ATP-dependent RNA helicase DHH1 [Drosophila mauritiana]|uniref:ATP-dependent RNA helicase DHH1 n=1 Tax=Drosophila mauritiana TaxID=7226 RepID=A0A6P8KI18_DROMA|nr:ATP-dependent RNA helicase DHH1 [Drosophila mauritiana]
MFRFFHLGILVSLISLISCFALINAQQQQQSHQQISGIKLHPSWLYSMPWRPLILPTASPSLPSLTALAQLSPGYTGPQTFPPVPQDQRQQTQQYQQHQQQQFQQAYLQQYQQPSVLVGLFTPQLQAQPLAAPPPQAGHFTLPFRPSPFAGYTDDGDEHLAQGKGNGIQEQTAQRELEEPTFHEHAYNNKPAAEGSQQPRGYVYLSPSNAYNLVRT